MTIAALPAILGSLALGLVLGLIPFVQDPLYWVILWIIPLSGLVYGVLAGMISFKLLKFLNGKATPTTLWLLVIAAAAGFAAIDAGRYLTHITRNPMEQGISLFEYIVFVQGLNQGWYYPVLYSLQLLGAAVSSWGVLLAGFAENPYCDTFRRYKSQEEQFDVFLSGDDSTARKLFAEIQLFSDEQDLTGLREFAQELREHSVVENAEMKIEFDERRCHSCEARTIFGVFSFPDEDDWSENDDFKFSVTSAPNSQVLQP